MSRGIRVKAREKSSATHEIWREITGDRAVYGARRRQPGTRLHPLVIRDPDPARDDAGVRLRTLRLRRGMTQVALAEMACISDSFVSMVETGQRSLRRASDILALADVLKTGTLSPPTKRGAMWH